MKTEKFDLLKKIDAETYISREAEKSAEDNVPTDERICNVVCTALTSMGYILPVGMYDRPSQALLDFFENSDEVDNIYKDTAPLLYKNYKSHVPGNFKPWEVHEVLAKGINLWLGEEVDTFTEIPVKDFSAKVSNGSAIVVSGKFDNSYELACIFGTKFYIDCDRLNNIDGYFEKAEMLRDFEVSNYPDKVYIKRFNKDVEEVDFVEFISKLKPYNNNLVKWVHIFKAPHATI